MLNTKRHAYWHRFVVSVFSIPHHMPSTKPHPHWCRFVFSKFSLPYHIYHTQNHTDEGVISFLDPFLAPRMNFEGCLLDILYIIKLLLHIFNLIYTQLTGKVREPRTRGRGTGIRRVRVRGSQKHPTGHPCPSLAASQAFELDS